MSRAGARWLILPAVALLGSWAWLAIDLSSVNILHTVVHENGRYTLAQTILYWSHFVREVPAVLMKTAFAAAALNTPRPARLPARRFATTPAVLAAVLLLVALGISSADHGLQSTLTDLAQFRTRDETAAFGSHWRYHLLSLLWFGLCSEALARWRLASSGAPLNRRVLLRAPWMVFMVLTLVAMPTTEPLRDPLFIGHQAREILNNTVMVMPICLGIGSMIAGESLFPSFRSWRRGLDAAGPFLPAAIVLVPAYLLIAGLSANVIDSGQTNGGLAPMLAAHVFEHSLDYVWAALLLCAVLLPHHRQAGRAL